MLLITLIVDPVINVINDDDIKLLLLLLLLLIGKVLVVSMITLLD